MEDDNGLELSLGLSFGGSSTKPKGKTTSSSESKPEEVDRGSKLVDDFKNYFRGGPQKQDSGSGSHQSDSAKPPENFFSGLPKTPVETDTSISLNGQETAGTNNKRPLLFDDMINQKKRERESQNPNIHGKNKQSHISITTEEGSTAENEDVAESEVDGSNNNNGVSSENDYKLGNFAYGVQFPMQSVNFMNNVTVKDSSTPVTVMPGHPISGLMQMGPAGNGERSGTQPVNTGNLPMMFGYSPVQLPMLDKDNSWGLFTQSQQIHPAFAGRGPPNLGAMQAIPRNPAESGQLDVGTTEQLKSEGKQPAIEENRSSKTEDDLKGSNLNNNRQTADFDFSPIKPGVAADVKFGGSGSFPNLPWVSTTGHGPNGRTISGVTYRFSANQIRIVCACHGSHMSPEEFVRHASEVPTDPVGTFPNSNPAASAQS